MNPTTAQPARRAANSWPTAPCRDYSRRIGRARSTSSNREGAPDGPVRRDRDWRWAIWRSALERAGAEWASDGSDRARACWWDVHQRGLYADQDDGGERARGAPGPSGRGLRRADWADRNRHAPRAAAEARHRSELSVGQRKADREYAGPGSDSRRGAFYGPEAAFGFDC